MTFRKAAVVITPALRFLLPPTRQHKPTATAAEELYT